MRHTLLQDVSQDLAEQHEPLSAAHAARPILVPAELIGEVNSALGNVFGCDPFDAGYDLDFSFPVRAHTAEGKVLTTLTDGRALAAACETALLEQSQNLQQRLTETPSIERRQALFNVMQRVEQAEDMLSAVAANVANPKSRAELFRDELPRFRHVSFEAALYLLRESSEDAEASHAARTTAQALLRGAHKSGENAINALTKRVGEFSGLFQNIFRDHEAEAQQARELLLESFAARKKELDARGQGPMPANYRRAINW